MNCKTNCLCHGMYGVLTSTPSTTKIMGLPPAVLKLFTPSLPPAVLKLFTPSLPPCSLPKRREKTWKCEKLIDWLWKMIMHCLFRGTSLLFSSKKLPKYQNTIFKYYGIIEFLYRYQIATNRQRTGIFFQKNLNIFKLLLILFISYFDIYWKFNNICNS